MPQDLTGPISRQGHIACTDLAIKVTWLCHWICQPGHRKACKLVGLPSFIHLVRFLKRTFFHRAHASFSFPLVSAVSATGRIFRECPWCSLSGNSSKSGNTKLTISCQYETGTGELDQKERDTNFLWGDSTHAIFPLRKGPCKGLPFDVSSLLLQC